MKSIKIKAQPKNSGGKVIGGNTATVVTSAGKGMPAAPAAASPAGPASSPSESGK